MTGRCKCQREESGLCPWLCSSLALVHHQASPSCCSVFFPFPFLLGMAALWDSESLVVGAGGSVIVVWSCSQMVGKEFSPRLGFIAEEV